MKGWTEKYVQQLKDAGRIVDYKFNGGKIRENTVEYSGNKLQNIPKKRNKTKEWIALNLSAWCKVNGFELLAEHKFHTERKWRFDWAVLKDGKPFIAWEYDGLMSAKSRHTTPIGFSNDAEKLNCAASLGWTVYRYTVLNYKMLLTDLERIIVWESNFPL